MLSIGQIAHTTGVSRRMLRHWEDVGLLEPAAVDEHTGYRRYAASQVGRVRAVAALRAVGFGLEAHPSSTTPRRCGRSSCPRPTGVSRPDWGRAPR